MLITAPDLVIGPWVIRLQLDTVVGTMVGVNVCVGVSVMVGVIVLVGVWVAVKVNGTVGVEVGVGVFEGVLVGEGLGVFVKVGVLACQVTGGAVTAMETLTKMVRALLATIGLGGVLVVLRMIKGTILGTMGMKVPSIFTISRVVLPALGVKLLVSTGPVQYSVSFNPVGEGGLGP